MGRNWVFAILLIDYRDYPPRKRLATKTGNYSSMKLPGVNIHPGVMSANIEMYCWSVLDA